MAGEWEKGMRKEQPDRVVKGMIVRGIICNLFFPIPLPNIPLPMAF
jgi:hypothetical protein